MRKISLLILIFVAPNLKAQQLNINETLEYIESIENVYRIEWSHSQVKYELNSEGVLSQEEYFLKDTSVLKGKTSVHVDDIIKEVSIEDDNYIILKCKNKNCFTITYRANFDDEKTETAYINHDNRYPNGLRFVVRQEYQAKKMINALNYLFSLIKNEKFFRDINDPFVKNIITIDDSANKKVGKIKLNEKNGTFIVNVKFKSLNIPFVLDSGAAEISISSTLEKQLLANGTITKDDYLSDGLYRVADGRIVSQRRVLIKKLAVGEFTVRNVPASIGSEDTPLLLGKNFLDKFNSWSIDNSEKTLELKI
jgi:clan AA aspartic protease (TIGR02281 family)